MRSQILRIYNEKNEKVSETACKSEIRWYIKNKPNHSFVRTGSYVVRYK